MRIAPLILLLTALGPLRAAAQPVIGVVVEEGTGTPVPGAMVILYDSTDTQVARVLSNAAGRFLVRAVDPGPHYITVERIGYANWTTDPFEPEPDGELLTIQVPVVAIPLEGLDVSGARRCEVRPEEGQATARVWEEVRKALSAEEYTREASLYRYTLLRYERQLDRDAEETIEEDTTISENLAAAFRSFPIGYLASRGFVQATEDNNTVYFAPDAGALLSDPFLDSHCFGLREGEQGRIGLIFRPLEGREVPDIGGVLWVNAATSELERLEFVYLNLIRSREIGEPGGEVAFTRLPDGAWIVRDWRIRMPNLEEARRGRVRRTGYSEEGGVTWAITDARDRTVLHAESASISGVVTDSLGIGPPLEPVVVVLAGTRRQAIAEEDGSFLLTGLSEGRHVLRVARPLLSNQGMASPEEVVVEGKLGEVAHVRLRAPSVTDVLAASCGGAPRPGGTVAFLGRIATVDGVPRAEMAVDVRWLRASGYSALAVAAPVGPEGMEDRVWTMGRDGAFATARTTTDWRGLFMLCDVPAGSRLRVSVSGPEEEDPVLRETFFVPLGESTVVESLVLPTAEDRMSTVVVKMESAVDRPAPDTVAEPELYAPAPATREPGPDTTAFRVTLHLRDVEDNAPLLGALIELPDHPEPYVTGMNGTVSLEIPPGRYTLTANKGGYTTLHGAFRVVGEGDLQVLMRELRDVDTSIAGRLVVRVSEFGSGRLIQGASVSVNGDGGRLSDGQGSAEFGGLEGPVVQVSVEGFGYETHTGPVTLNEEGTTVVEVAMAINALVLDPIEVEAGSSFLERMGVNWRVERGWPDSLLTRETLMEEGKPNLADAFRRLPGVMVSFRGPIVILTTYGGCPIPVLLDGRNVGTSVGGLALNDIPAEYLEMAEVYQKGRVPGRFGQSPCGLILLWSREAAMSPTPPARRPPLR